MFHKPHRFFDMDDEHAPIDYTCVSSVSEGRRREQRKNIPKDGARRSVRHRAEPEEGGASFPSASPEFGAGRRTVAGKLPSMEDGPAPAARVAYPRASEIPENPFDPSEEEAAWNDGPKEAVAQPILTTQDGSQFDPPAMAQLPEWYRVAQQNSLPREDRLRRAPKVQAAPRYDQEEELLDPLGRPVRRSRAVREKEAPTTAKLYEEAGYPPELVNQQRDEETQWANVSRRRRHGAQYAVREDRQAEYLRSTDGRHAPREASRRYDPPERGLPESRPEALPQGRPAPYAGGMVPRTFSGGYEIENDVPGTVYAANPYARNTARDHGTDAPEDMPEETAPEKRFGIPWLGIAAFTLAFLAVGLWLGQMWFDARTEHALATRREAAELIAQSHPFEYRDWLEREARKNNLNPAFVAAIVYNESTFRSGAESNVGARGLMQVMPDTADTINKDLNVANYNFDMLYDAETNLIFGCHYLGELSQRFWGDPILVAAAYHAGPNQVQNWLNSSSLSTDGQSLILDNLADGPTKQYAARVKRDFAIYRRLYYENTEEGA